MRILYGLVFFTSLFTFAQGPQKVDPEILKSPKYYNQHLLSCQKDLLEEAKSEVVDIPDNAYTRKVFSTIKKHYNRQLSSYDKQMAVNNPSFFIKLKSLKKKAYLFSEEFCTKNMQGSDMGNAVYHFIFSMLTSIYGRGTGEGTACRFSTGHEVIYDDPKKGFKPPKQGPIEGALYKQHIGALHPHNSSASMMDLINNAQGHEFERKYIVLARHCNTYLDTRVKADAQAKRELEANGTSTDELARHAAREKWMSIYLRQQFRSVQKNPCKEIFNRIMRGKKKSDPKLVFYQGNADQCEKAQLSKSLERDKLRAERTRHPAAVVATE